MYLNIDMQYLMEIKMKLRKVLKFGLIAIALAFAGGFVGQFARADDSAQMATIDDIVQNYEHVTYLNPVKVCKDMEIPIYGEGTAGKTKSGDLLLGMILGGITGKVLIGNDKGAAIGAIGGSLIANDKAQKPNQIIVGYKQERRCTLEHREVHEKVPTDYTVTYSWNGVYGRSYTTQPYAIGAKIPIKVTIETR